MHRQVHPCQRIHRPLAPPIPRSLLARLDVRQGHELGRRHWRASLPPSVLKSPCPRNWNDSNNCNCFRCAQIRQGPPPPPRPPTGPEGGYEFRNRPPEGNSESRTVASTIPSGVASTACRFGQQRRGRGQLQAPSPRPVACARGQEAFARQKQQPAIWTRRLAIPWGAVGTWRTWERPWRGSRPDYRS